MENKQTAVEWLIEELGEYFPHEIGGIHLMVEQAKQMEKEQIKDAYSNGVVRHLHSKTILSEEYYNETYEK
jgi:hypothetical protein